MDCRAGTRRSPCLVERCRITGPAYAYLLGQYLGDGSLSEHRRGVFKLRLFCNQLQDRVIRDCADAIALITRRRPGSNPPRDGMIVVSSYSVHWPCVFPQHGPGLKHTRVIELVQWQSAIVSQHPTMFIRGLLHSDGCRVTNRVGPYEYGRYLFSNKSADIHRLLREACDGLAIHWTASRSDTTSIARRDDVARLDCFVGPKA